MTLAKVDWLGFRTKATPEEMRFSIERMLGEVAPVTLAKRGRGALGYQEAGGIEVGGMLVGQYGTGGESQRGWSSFALTGQGCEWVRDWDLAVDELGEYDAELRRCDLAVDTFRGEVTHAKVVAAHEAGGFTSGGRRPNLSRIEGWPRENGWSCYVGKRDQGKMFRGYEKGFEQAKKFREAQGLVASSIDGHQVEDWYRCEVELKAKDRALPEDLIERRDEYFAGSYPFCADLVEVKPFELSVAREKRPQLELEAALGLVRHQWGRTLFTALVAHHGDISAVWERIVGEGHSDALVKAGVLLVDH